MSKRRPRYADIKAAAAAAGRTIAPDSTMTVRSLESTTNSVVVLDRVVAGYEPDYCIHGYATCACCQHVVYLGSETADLAINGSVPVCRECANEHFSDLIPATQVQDHKTADGPHG